MALGAGRPATIRMRNRAPKASRVVLGDPTRLCRMLVDLRLNARESLEEAGRGTAVVAYTPELGRAADVAARAARTA